MSKGRPVANKHKVPKRQWRKWSRSAQKLFNALMYELRPSMQWVFTHPAAKLLPKSQWQITRYNVAFIAACALSGEVTGKVKNV